MFELYISFFFVYSIFAVVNPFLQVMLRNVGYSYEAVGILLSVFEVAGIVGPLVIGRKVDKTGRMKDAILISTGFSALGIILLMQSTHLWLTVVALMISAFFLRSLLPLLDTVATNRFNGNAQKYSLLRAFGTFGFVFFSLVFAVIKQPNQGSNLSIGTYALMGCLLFFFPVLTWKEVKQPKKQKTIQKTVVAKTANWYDVAFVVGLIIIAFNRLSMSAITSFLSLYLVEELHIDAISLMNGIGAGSEFFAMILAGYLIQKKGVLPVTLLLISGIGMIVRLLVIALVPSFQGVLIAQMLHSVGFGFFHPAAIQFVARRVKRSHRTIGMSLYISIGTGLPAVLGSSLGGVIAESYGYRTLFLSFTGFAVVSVVMCLMFWKLMTTPAIEEV